MVMLPRGLGVANRPPVNRNIYPFLQALIRSQQGQPAYMQVPGMQQMPYRDPRQDAMGMLRRQQALTNPMQGLQGLGSGMMQAMQSGQEPGQMTPDQRAAMSQIIASLIGRTGLPQGFLPGGRIGMPGPRSNNPMQNY